MITAAILVSYFQAAVAVKWGYVWSLNGELYTQALAEKYHKAKRKTSKQRDPATYWLKDCAKWIGKMAADCSGGIVGACRTVDPKYGDRTADTFKSQFKVSGPISTLPEIPGLALWYSGHIGIYEGNGYALEFRGTDYGAVRTKVQGRGWTHWGTVPGVDYGDAFVVDATLRPGAKGPEVTRLQELLLRWDAKCLPKFGADGDFGGETEKAVKAFQWAHGLDMDGVVTAGAWKLLEAEPWPEPVVPEVEPMEERPFRGLVKGTSVNVRKGRGKEHDLLCVAQNKPDEVDKLLLSNLKDGWYEVTLMPKSNGFSPVNGFISAEYIERV